MDQESGSMALGSVQTTLDEPVSETLVRKLMGYQSLPKCYVTDA